MVISGASPAASEERDYCWSSNDSPPTLQTLRSLHLTSDVFCTSLLRSPCDHGDSPPAHRDIWIAAAGDSVFQSQHINKLLKKQLQSLCKEGNNIKTSIGDVEKAMSSMEAKLSRIKQAETMKTLLEAEIQTAKKTLEEERVSASQKELYLRKLEKDNEDLNLRLLMLSEENSSLTVSRRASQRSHMQLWADVHKLGKKLQECKLAFGVEDEIFRKIKHQTRELEESIKEYEAVIQVLQNKEKSLQDQLSVAEEKARTLPRTPCNILNINPKSLMFEIVKAELEDKIRGKEKNQMKHIFGG
ncbi:uncharacterized protein LOC135973347 isoform X2 [Chrysemys picta bellii]|uniref:uncharacterized protein LOC135973347 isoform X2 n=1 Tax=Chrysemys picta bellii TaxID=8478 RepID=UPI0032B24F1F